MAYNQCETLPEALFMPEGMGYQKYQRRMKRTCGLDLLILDDLLLHTISDEREVKILFEVLEKRSG